ncbi:MAG: hypothetical protein JWN96_2149 [Mycobacterium sp.]|nr:hypothetical protein [Mycobacterium sp.]
MRLSLRGRRTATAGMALAVAMVGVFSSACAPAASTKVISGTIKGADGHVVDVMLGFDVLDARGNKIDLGYLNAGYSAIQRLNHCVPIQGATGTGVCPANYQASTRIHTDAQGTTYNWSLRVPANAVTVYVEAYPKEPTPNNWVSFRGYTGPMPGTSNVTEYGMTHRRSVYVGAGSRSGISIVLPRACGNGAHATSGTMAGHISGWPAGVNGSIYTWSTAPDQATLGFGVASVDGNGNYRLAALQGGQNYKVQAQGGGFFRTATSSGNVNACQTKTFNF